jgi:hypothetical protein
MLEYRVARTDDDMATVRAVRASVVEQILSKNPHIPESSGAYMRSDFFLDAERSAGYFHILGRKDGVAIGVVTVCCPSGEVRMPSEKYCGAIQPLKSGVDAEIFQLYVLDPADNPTVGYTLALLAYRQLREHGRRTVFINYFDHSLASFYEKLGFHFIERRVDNGLDTVYMHHAAEDFEAHPRTRRYLQRIGRELASRDASLLSAPGT